MFESDISLSQPSCTTEGPVWLLMPHSHKQAHGTHQNSHWVCVESHLALAGYWIITVVGLCFLFCLHKDKRKQTGVERKSNVGFQKKSVLICSPKSPQKTGIYCSRQEISCGDKCHCCWPLAVGRGLGQFSCVFVHQQETSMSEVSQRLRPGQCRIYTMCGGLVRTLKRRPFQPAWLV